MISENIHIKLPKIDFSEGLVEKGIWLCVLHANRIPPHIGLIINNKYFSLTIKGREVSDSIALTKMCKQKSITTLFIKIKEHPVFSFNYLSEVFASILQSYSQVKQFESTCLSPVKKFFNEFYACNSNEDELFFEFIQKLNNNDFLLDYCSLNYKSVNQIELPVYTLQELNEKIKNERSPYYNE
jgi:hypothetical protein